MQSEPPQADAGHPLSKPLLTTAACCPGPWHPPSFQTAVSASQMRHRKRRQTLQSLCKTPSSSNTAAKGLSRLCSDGPPAVSAPQTNFPGILV